LLEQGADIKIVNKSQQTPLHLAAAKGSAKAMEIFLKHSNTTEDVINLQDSYGDTALHDAVACDHKAIARLLLTYGADFSIKNKQGRTAVHVSALKSAEMRDLMHNKAATLGATMASQRQLDKSDVVKRIRLDFPIGPNQCPELEVALSDNFSSLREMQEYMLEINSEDRIIFSSELVKSLNISKIRTKTKVMSFLPRLIDEVVSSQDPSSPPSIPSLYKQDSGSSTSSFDEFTIPEIKWDQLTLEGGLDTRVVGVGSFGVVVRGKYAYHGKKNSKIDVAVKIMTTSFMNEVVNFDCIRERAWVEANIIHRAGLSVQNDTVVKLYGVVEGPLPESWQRGLNNSKNDIVIGIVMKYEAGGSLESLLHGQHKREVHMSEKVRILRCIANGLCELHSLPIEYYIVHGDIKPANVLLGGQSPCTVKLADFGISDVKDSLMSTCQMSVLHSTHTRRGTPVYSAPELLPSPENLKVGTPTRSSDMYAFGILAWEVLTGKRPFNDVSTEMELCMTVHCGVRPDLTDLPSHTPPNVVEMIRSCFNVDRSTRMTADECFVLLDHVHMRVSSSRFDIFFSHPWSDKSFLKHVFAILSTVGYRVWYDMLEMKWDLDKSMNEGVKNSSVVVACVNSTYQSRPNCIKELRMANEIDNPKKPIVCLVTESVPLSWASEELKGLCSFEANMYCDIGKHALLGNEAWENPTEDMVSSLQKSLQPLFKILDELQIEKSLLTSSL
jgi:serine/threonine protein kinase